MYQCIGQRRVSNHAGERSTLVRCTNESEVPTNPNRPEWGFLCASCSGAPPVANSPKSESNVMAIQDETREYRDQIESGFMLGMRSSNTEERDDE
jgi:hypothetical protein